MSDNRQPMREGRGDGASVGGLFLSGGQVLYLNCAAIQLVLAEDGDETRLPRLGIFEGFPEILAVPERVRIDLDAQVGGAQFGGEPQRLARQRRVEDRDEHVRAA